MQGTADPGDQVEEAAGEAGTEKTMTERRLVAMVRGEDVHLDQSASIVTTARGKLDMRQSASVVVASGDGTKLSLAAAVALPALGDVTLEKSFAQWLISAGDVSIDKGGCIAAVAPEVRIERGAAGVVLARNVEIGEGGRVLLNPIGAAILGVGLGIGFGVAVAASAAWAGVRAWKNRPDWLSRS